MFALEVVLAEAGAAEAGEREHETTRPRRTLVFDEVDSDEPSSKTISSCFSVLFSSCS